jgi:hypothetical protein
MIDADKQPGAVMVTERLRNLETQREALLRRIVEAKEGRSAELLVPQMCLALEALDQIIARERAPATN